MCNPSHFNWLDRPSAGQSSLWLPKSNICLIWGAPDPHLLNIGLLSPLEIGYTSRNYLWVVFIYIASLFSRKPLSNWSFLSREMVQTFWTAVYRVPTAGCIS